MSVYRYCITVPTGNSELVWLVEECLFTVVDVHSVHVSVPICDGYGYDTQNKYHEYYAILGDDEFDILERLLERYTSTEKRSCEDDKYVDYYFAVGDEDS